MMARFLLPVIMTGFDAVGEFVQIPRGMRGRWAGNISASTLGPIDYPLSYDFLVISAPDAAGNSFLWQDDYSQLMRVQSNIMQYCFNYDTPGADEAPFQVVPARDNELTFCWRGPRLPTHKIGCTGCDCANWTLQLVGDILHSTFMMSPPVLHLKMSLVRIGDAPSPENVSRGWNCEFDNHTGPPSIATSAIRKDRKNGPGVCSSASEAWMNKHVQTSTPTVENCVVVNSKHDVRLQYVASKLPCMPCDVHFTVSAATPRTSSSIKYFAMGFKGLYGAYQESAVDSPDYFGMSSVGLGAKVSPLTGRIVLGYNGTAQIGCVRQLKADAYAGSVVEVLDDGVIRNTKVRSDNGRTSITFIVSMHAGRDEKELSWHGLQRRRGWGEFEFMWAIGTIGGNGTCGAPIEFHSTTRGLAALGFPAGRFECNTESFEKNGPSEQYTMLGTDFFVI